jgi:hypothetical protein
LIAFIWWETEVALDGANVCAIAAKVSDNAYAKQVSRFIGPLRRNALFVWGIDRELLVGMVNSPLAGEYITRVLVRLEVTRQIPGEVCGSSVAVEASTRVL